jgi:hypothetical protein
MPYAMGIFSLEMLDGYFTGDVMTLGELVTQSKNQMYKFNESKSRYHQLVSSMGKSFSPEPGLLTEERGEHIHLMHLLGDPLLKLHRPQPLELKTADSVLAGQPLVVSGIADQAGELTIDLSYRRDRFRTRPPRRKTYVPTRESFAAYQKVYERTQNLVCVQKSRRVDTGPFSIKLIVPEDCSGACHVRGMLHGKETFALGATDIQIRKQRD